MEQEYIVEINGKKFDTRNMYDRLYLESIGYDFEIKKIKKNKKEVKSEENKKVIKRAFDMGCDIQNHSWTHPGMSKLSKEEILEEYNKCDQAIIDITGVKPEFFRPPFIDVNDLMHETIPTPFICGYGVEDWVPAVSADERYERMLAGAKDGLLYLLHVMEGNQATVDAVDRIIPVLKEQGYEFVTTRKMFELKGVDKKAHTGILWTEVK